MHSLRSLFIVSLSYLLSSFPTGQSLHAQSRPDMDRLSSLLDAYAITLTLPSGSSIPDSVIARDAYFFLATADSAYVPSTKEGVLMLPAGASDSLQGKLSKAGYGTVLYDSTKVAEELGVLVYDAFLDHTQTSRGPKHGTLRGLGAYPIPSNSSVVLQYALESPSHVRVQVYSSLGMCVYTTAGSRQEGMQREFLNLRDYASGVYIARIQARSEGREKVGVQKLLLVK